MTAAPPTAPLLQRARLAWLCLCLLALVGCDGDAARGERDSATQADTVSDTAQPDGRVPKDIHQGDTHVPDTAPPDTAADTVDSSDAADALDSAEPDTSDTSDTVEEPLLECETGAIKGRICGYSLRERSRFRVSVETTDCNGVPSVVEASVDACGYFELVGVPVGVHTLVVHTGAYTRAQDGVEVRADQTTDLTALSYKACGCDDAAKQIAVLTGVFDHVEVVLDGLGITYDLYAGDSADLDPDSQQPGYALLQDRVALLGYDVLIINSGEWYRLFGDPRRADERDLMLANLDAYVQSGGSLLVTDWAYPWVEMLYPGAVQFYGDPQPDDSGVHTPGAEGAARIGALDSNVAATIESDPFRYAIGAEMMHINFNWSGWTVATGAGFQTEVHVRATQAPLAVEPWVQPDAPLVVSYKPTQTSGTVFFAAFNLAVQPTDQMEDVVLYVIFQL